MSSIRKYVPFFFVLSLFFTFNNISTAQTLDHVQGEILVVLEEGTSFQRFQKDISIFENVRSSAELKEMNTNPIKMWRVQFDQNRVHEGRFLHEIRNKKEVKMAQFNHLIAYRNIPNDPRFGQQWQYLNDGTNGVEGADIDMDLAWDITTGGLTANGDTIVACVIDGGMDPSHEDFGDNLWKNYDEIPDNGVDDDNNGYVDDFHGWSAYDNNGNIFKGGSHGTPVAGIIGAQGNNGIGVSGVNWDVKLMIIRGGGSEAAALEAYAYPYTMRKRYNESDGERGAFVVSTNASWGTDLLHWEDAPIWCSFYDSLGMVGILNCGATANANYDIDELGDMPTSCPSDYLLSVTNMYWNDIKVTKAGYGLETIDLGAYGEDTYTVAKNNSYGAFGGTSGATPHVTGTIALAYSLDCSILADLAMDDPAQAAILVKEFVLQGVKPNESLENITVSGGKLNVNNTLLMLENYCGNCPYPVSVDITNIRGNQATLEWTSQVDSSNFDLVFKEQGVDTWDTLFNVQSPVLLEELYYCTKYNFKIRTRCENEDGTFSFIFDFETDGCCVIPSSHEVIALEDSLMIVLDDILATNTYTLEYRKFGEPSWYTISQDTNAFVIPSPPDCKFIYYRFRSDCVADTTAFSEWFQTEVDCPNCSEPNMCEVEGGTFFEWIDEVQIGPFHNASGKDNDGYGEYGQALAVSLKAGKKYEFLLTPGFSDQFFDEYIRVYIDYNGNETFEEAELVLDAFVAGGEVLKEQLEIPAFLSPGITKMRIIMSFQEISDPCDNLTYGEAEDYCVELIESTDCFLGDLEIDTLSIGPDFANFSWLNYNDTESFDYRYRKEVDTDWMEGTSLDTFATIVNLDSCSSYVFQLRRICTDGSTDYSDSFLFDTDCTNSTGAPKPGNMELLVSPNPFGKFIDLTIPENVAGPFRINLYTINGRSILNKSISQRNVRLWMENHAVNNSSLYILELIGSNRTLVKKLVSLDVQ